MVAKIRFADGLTLTAETWEEIEDKLRTTQFIEFPDQMSFRRAMEDRISTQMGEEIQIDGTSKDFLYELSRAQLLDVIEGPKSAVEIERERNAPRPEFALIGGDKL